MWKATLQARRVKKKKQNSQAKLHTGTCTEEILRRRSKQDSSQRQYGGDRNGDQYCEENPIWRYRVRVQYQAERDPINPSNFQPQSTVEIRDVDGLPTVEDVEEAGKRNIYLHLPNWLIN